MSISKTMFRAPFNLIFAFITMIATILAIYFQVEKTRINISHDRFTIQTLDSLQDQNIRTKRNLEEVLLRIESINLKKDTGKFPPSISFALIARLDKMQNRLDSISDITIGLRQAINPMKPDEVLTIARLKDEMVENEKNFANLEANFNSKQQEFESSIRQEIAASNQSTSLILVVLIPLVLNFLYTVWKDFKKEREHKEKKEQT